MGTLLTKTAASNHKSSNIIGKNTIMPYHNNQDILKILGHITPLMNEIFLAQDNPYTRGCRRNKMNSPDKNSENYEIKVPLKLFDPSQVKISINEKALMTISASTEFEKETDRNGMRKTISIVEETIQLPDYLLSDLHAVSPNNNNNNEENPDNSNSSSKAPALKLISKVKTKFDSGFLIITVPNKPEEKGVESLRDAGQGPVDIEI